MSRLPRVSISFYKTVTSFLQCPQRAAALEMSGTLRGREAWGRWRRGKAHLPSRPRLFSSHPVPRPPAGTHWGGWDCPIWDTQQGMVRSPGVGKAFAQDRQWGQHDFPEERRLQFCPGCDSCASGPLGSFSCGEMQESDERGDVLRS